MALIWAIGLVFLAVCVVGYAWGFMSQLASELWHMSTRKRNRVVHIAKKSRLP